MNRCPCAEAMAQEQRSKDGRILDKYLKPRTLRQTPSPQFAKNFSLSQPQNKCAEFLFLS